MLEAPAYPAQPTPTPAKRSASETDDALRAAKGNRALWIVLVVIAVLVIGAVIAILVTR